MDEKELQIKELIGQGEMMYSTDQYVEAIRYYDKALKLDSRNVEVMFKKVEAYIMNNDSDKAKETLNKILEIDDTLGEVYFHLANIALLEDDNLKGKALLTKAIKNGYVNANVYINLAIAEEQSGDYENAIRYYNKAMKVEPDNLLSRSRKIQLLHMINRDDEALVNAKKLIGEFPHIFEGYHFAIHLYLGKKLVKEAKEVLDDALSLFPDDLGFKFDYIKILEAEEKYEEALKYLEDNFSMDNDMVIKQKVDLLISMNKIDESKDLVLDLYERTHDESYLILIYTILLGDEDYDKLISIADDYIKNTDNDLNYYASLYYKSLGYLRKGDKETATALFKENIKEYRMAVASNPTRTDLQIYRVISHKEIGEYDKALELLNFVLKIKKNVAELYALKSEILRLKGDFLESEIARKKANEMNSIV